MTHTPPVDLSPGCLEVSETLAGGRALSEAEALHVSRCPVCGASGHRPPSDAGDAGSLFAAVQADLIRERGATAWLRSLPTRSRVATGVIVAGGLAFAIGLQRFRGHLAPVPVDRVVLVVTVLLALLALTLRLALRPLQAAPPSARLPVICFAAGLLLPFFFALGPFPTEFAGVPGVSFAKAAASCFCVGVLTGALVVLALRALDRGAHGSRNAALLSATAGGLTANVALELHCPATAPAHLLLGHAAVALVLVVSYGALARQREIG